MKQEETLQQLKMDASLNRRSVPPFWKGLKTLSRGHWSFSLETRFKSSMVKRKNIEQLIGTNTAMNEAKQLILRHATPVEALNKAFPDLCSRTSSDVLSLTQSKTKHEHYIVVVMYKRHSAAEEAGCHCETSEITRQRIWRSCGNYHSSIVSGIGLNDLCLQKFFSNDWVWLLC